jgi:hypothetical protein
MKLIVGELSATNQVDDHEDDRLDITVYPRVVSVVSLRLAI